MKKNILIIGAGGVGHVVAHKCAQYNDALGDIHIASRTPAKCAAIIHSIREKANLKVPGKLVAHSLDAFNVEQVAELIRTTGCQIVINVAPSFLNMSVLSACLQTGAAYIDTAIYEDPLKICETPPWYANYEWTRRDACAQAGVTAILGAGFDPGVVNVYARLAQQVYFDHIDSIDIIDINAADHGRYFATNFDPEINFREFTGQVWSWQNSQWVANKMFEVCKEWELPVVGKCTTYMTGHDELHSLSQTLGVANIRFWMNFSEHYIQVFTVLQQLGLLSEQPVKMADGQEVVPLKVVKAVLPEPASLAADYVGKTCIGEVIKGLKAGKPRELFIYNVSDHTQAYQEVESQAISYTAGVPAVAAARLIASGVWDVKKMVNMENLPPAPFLNLIGSMGLPTRIRDEAGDRLLSDEEIETTSLSTKVLSGALSTL